MQTPFDLGVAFLEIFVASVMLLVILTATGQIERLLQTQTALAQQIDTQRQTSDLRRFHQAQIPYYEVLGAIHTHSRYNFPVIITRESVWVDAQRLMTAPFGEPIRYIDVFVEEMRQHMLASCANNCLFFTATPANTVDLNNDIRGRSTSLRFNARVLQEGSGAPIALLFTY